MKISNAELAELALSRSQAAPLPAAAPVNMRLRQASQAFSSSATCIRNRSASRGGSRRRRTSSGQLRTLISPRQTGKKGQKPLSQQRCLPRERSEIHESSLASTTIANKVSTWTCTERIVTVFLACCEGVGWRTRHNRLLLALRWTFVLSDLLASSFDTRESLGVSRARRHRRHGWTAWHRRH
jgi:hypothetical protein